MDLENKEGANTQNGKIYKRNQLAIGVVKALFIAEGEEKIEKMSLRGKMTLIAKEGDEDFTNWFYVQGASDALQGTWENFRIFVIEYCTDTGLESIKSLERRNSVNT